MNVIETIKKDISQLSREERADLAHWIITNQDTDDETEIGVDQAWRNEIRSRVQALKNGTVEMIPSAVLWKDLFDNYGKNC